MQVVAVIYGTYLSFHEVLDAYELNKVKKNVVRMQYSLFLL